MGETKPLLTNEKKTDLNLYFAREPLNIQKAAFHFTLIHEWFKRRYLSRFRIFACVKDKINRSIPSAKGHLLQDGFYYLEGPRFHNGYFYVSDMYQCKVYKIDPENGTIVHSISFQDQVSGLGWLSTGELVVVLMKTMKIAKYNEETNLCETYADISPYCRVKANDMVVGVDDHIYVGNFGFDVENLLAARTSTIVHVNPQQKVTLAEKRLYFPNGSVITPDGKTLIVVESMRGCLTAFDIDHENDGQLENRRKWAAVNGVFDGICLDAEGCVWAAVCKVGIYNTSGCVLRIEENSNDAKECYGFSCNGLSACCIATNLYTDEKDQSWLFVVEAKTVKEKVIMNHLKGKNSWITKIPVSVGPAKRDDDSRYHAGMC